MTESFFSRWFSKGKTSTASTEVMQNEDIILSPVSGQLVDLAKVNDPVFSSGMMGQGIAIQPKQGVLYAPADAEVTIAFETGHAYGLKTVHGAEILLHIGIDTVSMEGDGFERLVTEGMPVKAGDKLGVFDLDKIGTAGLEATTMVIITNSADYKEILPSQAKTVEVGDHLLALKR